MLTFPHVSGQPDLAMDAAVSFNENSKEMMVIMVVNTRTCIICWVLYSTLKLQGFIMKRHSSIKSNVTQNWKSWDASNY